MTEVLFAKLDDVQAAVAAAEQAAEDAAEALNTVADIQDTVENAVRTDIVQSFDSTAQQQGRENISAQEASANLTALSAFTVDTDPTLAANSNTRIPSQAAVKAFLPPSVLRPETLTYINSLTIKPDAQVAWALDDLIGTLIDGDVWSELDGVYLRGMHTEEASLISLKSPGTRTMAVSAAGPIFAAGGYTEGDGANYYSIAANNAFTNFLQDDNFLGVFILEDATSNNLTDLGTRNGTARFSINPKNNASQIAVRNSTASAVTTVATVPSSVGFTWSRRNNSATVDVGKDGTSLETIASVSATLNTAMLVEFQHGDTNFSTRKHFAIVIGGYLNDTKVGILNDALWTLYHTMRRLFPDVASVPQNPTVGVSFPTKAAAAAAAIDVTVSPMVFVRGYMVEGDGGHGYYLHQPGGSTWADGEFVDTKGQVFQLVLERGSLYDAQLGVVADATEAGNIGTINNDAIRRIIASPAKTVRWQGGGIRFDETIVNDNPRQIWIGTGKVDFSNNPSTTTFPIGGTAFIYTGQGNSYAFTSDPDNVWTSSDYSNFSIFTGKIGINGGVDGTDCDYLWLFYHARGDFWERVNFGHRGNQLSIGGVNTGGCVFYRGFLEGAVPGDNGPDWVHHYSNCEFRTDCSRISGQLGNTDAYEGYGFGVKSSGNDNYFLKCKFNNSTLMTDQNGGIHCVGCNFENTDWGSEAASTFAVTFDHTVDTVNRVSHALPNGQRGKLKIVSGTLPVGLDTVTTYYVVNKTADTFQISLTSGGSAVTFSDNGTGTFQFSVAAFDTLTTGRAAWIIKKDPTYRGVAAWFTGCGASQGAYFGIIDCSEYDTDPRADVNVMVTNCYFRRNRTADFWLIQNDQGGASGLTVTGCSASTFRALGEEGSVLPEDNGLGALSPVRFKYSGGRWRGLRVVGNVNNFPDIWDTIRDPIIGWYAAFNSTTLDTRGIAASSVGTASANTLSSSTFINSWPHVTYTSDVGANKSAEVFGPQFCCVRSSTLAQGGYFARFRWSCPAVASDDRGFVGLNKALTSLDDELTALSGSEPSDLTQCIGVGFDTGEANYCIIAGNGTPNVLHIDLGDGFPANLTTAVYELSIWCGAAGTKHYVRVERLDDPLITDIYAFFDTDDTPAANQRLAPHMWRNTSADTDTATTMSPYLMEIRPHPIGAFAGTH